MADQPERTLHGLLALGSPAQFRLAAARDCGPISPLPVNTHVHLPPNFSMFQTVRQAVTLAADENIAALGVSNYYDWRAYGEFAECARANGVFPLFGLEVISMQDDLRKAGIRVNDPDNPGRTYLCGKGITRFDRLADKARKLVDVIRRNDSTRMTRMIDRLRKVFYDRSGLDLNVDEGAVVDMVVRRHCVPRETVYLQERHVAQALQEAIFECVPPEERIDRLNSILGVATKASGPEDRVAIQSDIRSHLMKAGKPAFVEETFISFPEAYRLILEFGGIPSYPVLGDAARPLCEYERDPAELIRKLRANNVHAVEWIAPRNRTSLLRDYVGRMRDAGFAQTAGTEHNTLDPARITPSCRDGELPDDLRTIFWEGACIVAAHQFLTLHGECGYVDAEGRPHAGYRSADERIKGFARIGAAVIQRYVEGCP